MSVGPPKGLIPVQYSQEIVGIQQEKESPYLYVLADCKHLLLICTQSLEKMCAALHTVFPELGITSLPDQFDVLRDRHKATLMRMDIDDEENLETIQFLRSTTFQYTMICTDHPEKWSLETHATRQEEVKSFETLLCQSDTAVH